MATLEDFEKIDIRVGVVIEITPFSGGKHSTHILMIDFGQELGVRKSLARLAPNYDGPVLVGRQAGGSFGSQWAFPSQQSLRDMLVLLDQYGYRGFNRFLINTSSARAVREVQWMAELKPEIVGLVVASKQPPRTGRVTPEQAIAAARANSRIEHLLRKVKSVRSTVEFSDQWNVWLVDFYRSSATEGSVKRTTLVEMQLRWY